MELDSLDKPLARIAVIEHLSGGKACGEGDNKWVQTEDNW
jgi:hypothetical protein